MSDQISPELKALLHAAARFVDLPHFPHKGVMYTPGEMLEAS